MVLNHHYHQCLQNVVPKTEKNNEVCMWYAQMVYMLPRFIIVGTYYIHILVNVVLLLSTAIVKTKVTSQYKVVLLPNI